MRKTDVHISQIDAGQIISNIRCFTWEDENICVGNELYRYIIANIRKSWIYVSMQYLIWPICNLVYEIKNEDGRVSGKVHTAVTAINLFGSFAHTWFSLMCLQTTRLYVIMYINRSKCKTLRIFENIFNASPSAQSICTHYSCFENMGWFVTLKKRVQNMGCKKQGAKKQGHCYSKREEARLLLEYFEPFLKFQTLKNIRPTW